MNKTLAGRVAGC